MNRPKAEVATLQTDLSEIKTEVLQIHAELKDIRRQLETLDPSGGVQGMA